MTSLAPTPAGCDRPRGPRTCAAALEEGLGRQDHLHLAGADPEGEGTNAPWVAVWLSPQTIVMPGWVRPSSGPMT